VSRPTLGEKIRYRFDNTLSRGAAAQIAWLGLMPGVRALRGPLSEWDSLRPKRPGLSDLSDR
jgi:hypothetical protein